METMTKLFGGVVLLALFSLAACDNVADQPANVGSGDQAAVADLSPVSEAFEKVQGVVDQASPTWAAETRVLMSDALTAPYGESARPGDWADYFGPFSLELCGDFMAEDSIRHHFPGGFDVYTINLGPGTGDLMFDFELLTDEHVEAGAKLCVEGRGCVIVEEFRKPDADGRVQIMMEDVEGPVQATLYVSYFHPTPPSGREVGYRIDGSFLGDACFDCQVTEDCITVQLLGITPNDDGSNTYDFKVTSNCDHGLSFIAFELPADVAAALNPWASVDLDDIENPGGQGGDSPQYNNIKFELGGDFKDGDMGTFSFTLPAGAEYDGEIRIKTKSSNDTIDLTLDISDCDD